MSKNLIIAALLYSTVLLLNFNGHENNFNLYNSCIPSH